MSNPHTVRGMTIFCTQGASVNISSGCMASRDILLYSSKSHGLYSSINGSRRSKSSIEIGERVWIGQGVKILTGAQIGNGSVVGAFSVLAGKVPNNCAAAGNPCKVTSKNVFWTGNAVPDDGNYFEMLKRENLPIPPFVRLTDESS
ncbi:hypothetical protein KHC28_23995 [Ancylobacter sonchi]|nr:hypothetical protein [Ancylobacter sonchi]